MAGLGRITSGDVFDKVQARLNRQVERKVQQRPTAHLLTGVGRCGVCGFKMRVVTKAGQASYDCADRHCVASVEDGVRHIRLVELD